MTVVGSMRGWGKPIHVGQASTTPGGSGAGVASISQKTGDSMSYQTKVVGYGASHLWPLNEAAGNALDVVGGDTAAIAVTGANPTRRAATIPSIPSAAGYALARADTNGSVELSLADDGASLVAGNGDWSYVWWNAWSAAFLGAEDVLLYGNFQTTRIEAFSGPSITSGHPAIRLTTSGVALTPADTVELPTSDADGEMHCFAVVYEGATRTFSVYSDGALRGTAVGSIDLSTDLPGPAGTQKIIVFNNLENFKYALPAYFPLALTRAQVANLALGDGSALPGLTVLPLFFNNGSNGAGWLANDFAVGAIDVTRAGFFQVTMNGTVSGTVGETFEATLRGSGLKVSGVIGAGGTASFSGTTTGTFPIGQEIGPVDFQNNGTHTMQVTAVATVTLIGSLADPGTGSGSGGTPTPPPPTGATQTVTPSTPVATFLSYVADTSVSLIEFAGGSYPWRSVLIDVDRTAAFPLVIQPQAGATVTFTGSTLPTIGDGVFIWGSVATATYITMQGFGFQNYLLWNTAIHGLHSTDHVSLLNMTFSGNTRDAAAAGSDSTKTMIALLSMRGGVAANTNFTIDNWNIIGAGRSVLSGIEIDGSSVTEATVALTNVTIRDCDYAFYENAATTGLTLDAWNVTNCGHAGASVSFHHAAGSYGHMTFTSADPLAVDGSTMVDAGANTTTAPRASHYDVPSSIDATGATDVAGPLADWINSLPNDSEVRFNATGVYKLLSALKLIHRTNMTFTGNNAQIKALGSGYNENYSLFYFVSYGGGNSGIIIHNFRLIGNSPTPGTFISGQEGQHGVLVDGGTNFEIYGCTITNTYGDGIEVNSGANHVRGHDNIFNDIGRNALSVIWGNHVEFDHNNVGHMGYMPFDIEPNNASQPCSFITIHDNQTAYWFNAWFAVDGSGTGAAISDISVYNNVSSGKSLLTVVVGPGVKYRISITGNASNVAASGPIFQLTRVDTPTVQHNTQPLSSGALVSTTACTGTITITPNP